MIELEAFDMEQHSSRLRSCSQCLWTNDRIPIVHCQHSQQGVGSGYSGCCQFNTAIVGGEASLRR